MFALKNTWVLIEFYKEEIETIIIVKFTLYKKNLTNIVLTKRHNMKILAIDDEKLMLLYLEKRLQELGYGIMTAESGEDGVELFNSFKPDLVIVDINMPGMSGLEVVKYIRNVQKSETPIMILSGNTDDNVINEGYSLGIEDYMKKPISLNEVSSRVKKILEEQ